jgi:hypothetical protein
MTRFLDSLASTLAGMLLAALMLAGFAPDAWMSAPRPALPFASPRPAARTEAPTVTRCLTASPVPGRVTPSPTVTGSGPESTRRPAAAVSLRGTATWFRSPAGVSAAGPDLRAALGPGWRGTSVRVCSSSACVVTVLGDTMAADRLIDLHRPLFARLAPLSVGVLRVLVTPIPAPPVTTRSDP